MRPKGNKDEVGRKVFLISQGSVSFKTRSGVLPLRLECALHPVLLGSTPQALPLLPCSGSAPPSPSSGRNSTGGGLLVKSRCLTNGTRIGGGEGWLLFPIPCCDQQFWSGLAAVNTPLMGKPLHVYHYEGQVRNSG